MPSPGRDRGDGIYANGEIVTYTVNITNVGPFACEVRDVNLTFTFPGPDGTPDPSTTIPIVTGATYVSGTPRTLVATLRHKLALNPGVTRTQARVNITHGWLQDLAGAFDPITDQRFVSTNVAAPTITIDKKGSIESGVAPQNVTYTYDVTTTASIPIPLKNVGVKDDLCSSPTYASGDDGDGQLEQGEVFRFTCTTLHQAPGTYTNTAYACALSVFDDREVCSPPDTWTVVLTPPPGNPPASPPPAGPPAETAVKPANATQAPCTLSTPKGLTVRAGEVTTIKATVRQVDAGTSVKITLPGGKTVSAKTNSKGVALLKVKPTKTGTARITVAECSEVQRLTVRAARKTQAKRVPRVTG
ncbi:hypothetical protein OJ997_13535 [Solirubrobacter phytolaccae]|uniref:DUF11 domain-containing protein n=1 Tax=Solirubrobacter phytolaccae TaxID=1404360 RepID=A0A9X3S8D4_9ACTN|nr:hypothetical protein [Solirubrobacter phytolaccae]MDA0181323.1 hypothetical protein [Solirubrobacter phytolaccae]